MSQEEAESHSKWNVLLRALGVAENVEIDSAMVQIQTGDVILLSSDGLHGLVSGTDIASVPGALPPQAAAAEELIERANKAGGTDNVTAVVAEVLSTDHRAGGIGGGGADATVIDDVGIGPKFVSAVRRLSPWG
jgi:protein phosphatase